MEMGGPSEGALSWGRCGVGQANLELGSSLSMRIIESSRDCGCHSADCVFPCPQARSGFEEGGAGPRKEHARSDSENWRSLREEQEEEEEGSWRLGAGPRRDGDRWRSSSPDGGPRSAGWREHGDRRRKFEFDLRGDRGGCGEEDGRGGGNSSHLRRCRGPDGFDDDKDGLPEWCLDDEDEEMGTFDASGAFLPLKKGPKESIPEEQELDFQGLEEEEDEPAEGLDEEGPEAGGKELTPLPPSEKSSSPSPLATLGPLWGANGEGGDAVEKDLPVTEGSQRVGLPFHWNQGLVVKTCLLWEGGARGVCVRARVEPAFLERVDRGLSCTFSGPSIPPSFAPRR